METSDKLAICKVVAQAILVDGELGDAEFELLDRLMERYGLDPTQRKQVRARNIDDDPAALVEGVTELGKAELLHELAKAILVDGEASPVERKLLDGVARTLGISDDRVEQAIAAAKS